MTTAKQLVLTDLEYTIWANQVLLRASTSLSQEELRRDLGASHTNLIRTLRHIYDAEHSWIHNLITNSIPSVAEMEAAGAADQSRPDPTLESLQQAWPKVWHEARQWISPLSDLDLARELNLHLRDGTDVLLPRWKVLRHMVNHSTFHRGQIITMLRTLGKRPPNVDLFEYYQLQPSVG